MGDVLVWLVAGAFWMLGPPLIDIDETEFYYVRAMPAYGGELRSTETWHDRRTGISARKRVFTSAESGLLLSTHVVDAACGRLAPDARPYIVAFQYQATNPGSRAAATMGVVFVEVYVRDLEGRIRVYRELVGQQMAALTRRYMPACARL